MIALGRYLKVLDRKEVERSAEQMVAVVREKRKVLHEKRDSVMAISDF